MHSHLDFFSLLTPEILFFENQDVTIIKELLSYVCSYGFILFVISLKADRVTEKERDHYLGHSVRGCKSWDWTRPKLGARSFVWDSHVGSGTRYPGPSSTVFAGVPTGS